MMIDSHFQSSDACTKHAITRFICTTRPQGNEVYDTDSHLEDWEWVLHKLYMLYKKPIMTLYTQTNK